MVVSYDICGTIADLDGRFRAPVETREALGTIIPPGHGLIDLLDIADGAYFLAGAAACAFIGSP